MGAFAVVTLAACASGPRPHVVLGAPDGHGPPGSGSLSRDVGLRLQSDESESSRYRIIHGLFGEIGEVAIRIRPAAGPPGPIDPGSPAGQPPQTEIWRARAAGSGDVLGFGRREQLIFTEFEPGRGHAARFTSFRRLPDREFTDVANQVTPGQVAIVRKRPGKPGEAATFVDKEAVFDPLSLLLFLRATPPRAERTFPMLDGQAFAQVTVTPRAHPEDVTLAGETFRTRVWDAIARPFTWKHEPSAKQSPHRFTIWVSDDDRHLPVLLRADTPFGDVRIELASTRRERGPRQLAQDGPRNRVVR